MLKSIHIRSYRVTPTRLLSIPLSVFALAVVFFLPTSSAVVTQDADASRGAAEDGNLDGRQVFRSIEQVRRGWRNHTERRRCVAALPQPF